MRKIFKYNFDVANRVIIPTHKIIRVLKFGSQDPDPTILTVWALVDPDTEPDSDVIDIMMFGTGHPIPDDILDEIEYIDTIPDEPFIWHLFRALGSKPLDREKTKCSFAIRYAGHRFCIRLPRNLKQDHRLITRMPLRIDQDSDSDREKLRQHGIEYGWTTGKKPVDGVS